MKLIQAMKKIKDLQIKASDLRDKVKRYCANLDCETEVYPDQKKQVQEWIQSHSDILKEVLKLRTSIQKTNIQTNVTMEIDGKQVTKSIAEWIHRKRDLAKYEQDMWSMLTDRNLKEGRISESSGQVKDVKIRRYYDPAERDKKMELYRSEPSVVDSTLEVVNAVTDLIEVNQNE